MLVETKELAKNLVLSQIDNKIASIQKKMMALKDDPANAGNPGSIWKYTGAIGPERGSNVKQSDTSPV